MIARPGERLHTTEHPHLMVAVRRRDSHEYARVLDVRRRGACVGTWINFDAGDQVAIHWRTAKGDTVAPATLQQLVAVCAGVA